jgi:hypothetical protein
MYAYAEHCALARHTCTVYTVLQYDNCNRCRQCSTHVLQTYVCKKAFKFFDEIEQIQIS